jgi:hypothetical protein
VLAGEAPKDTKVANYKTLKGMFRATKLPTDQLETTGFGARRRGS